MHLIAQGREAQQLAALVARVLGHGQVALLLQSARFAAHRRLVQADDLGDARGRDVGLYRHHGHHAPFDDADAEALEVQPRGATGQLVRQDREEVGDVVREVEHLTLLPALFRGGLFPRRCHSMVPSLDATGTYCTSCVRASHLAHRPSTNAQMSSLSNSGTS